MRRRKFFTPLASSLKKRKQEQIIRLPYFDDKKIFHKECVLYKDLYGTSCEENMVIIFQNKIIKSNLSCYLNKKESTINKPN